MANYEDIKSFYTVNDTRAEQVEAIAQSIKENGWQGAPILTYGDYRLITGSHRLEALEALYDDEEVGNGLFSADIAEDVTDLVDAYLAKNDIDFDDIDFADLGGIFAGTWVEEYANEIEEW